MMTYVERDTIDPRRDIYREGCKQYMAKIAGEALAPALLQFIESDEQDIVLSLNIRLYRDKYGQIVIG